MANMFGAVDFGFRPIRPEDESLTSGPAISTATAMDCGFSPRGDVRPEPVDSADWLETDALSDDDLFISDNETLPDATGFGARQRELNEAQAAKLAAEVTPALRSPFRGSTLRELCERFGDSCPTSATPCNVWCEVLETLRERERTKQRWRLDPNTARHMKYRTTLIEWILEVCADFGFGPTTADLAVHYMVRHSSVSVCATRSRRDISRIRSAPTAGAPRPTRGDFSSAELTLTFPAHHASRFRPLPPRRIAS